MIVFYSGFWGDVPFIKFKSGIREICGMSLYSVCLPLLCDSVFMNKKGPNKRGAVERPLNSQFVTMQVIDSM